MADILAKVFSRPLMRMWKFSKTEGLRICLALAFELCWLPFLKGQYSISNRVWSIISSLSQSRSSTTFIRVSESGSTLFLFINGHHEARWQTKLLQPCRTTVLLTNVEWSPILALSIFLGRMRALPLKLLSVKEQLALTRQAKPML